MGERASVLGQGGGGGGGADGGENLNRPFRCVHAMGPTTTGTSSACQSGPLLMSHPLRQMHASVKAELTYPGLQHTCSRQTLFRMIAPP